MVMGDPLKWNMWDIVVLCREKQTTLNLLGGSILGSTWTGCLWKTGVPQEVQEEEPGHLQRVGVVP